MREEAIFKAVKMNSKVGFITDEDLSAEVLTQDGSLFILLFEYFCFQYFEFFIYWMFLEYHIFDSKIQVCYSESN